METNGLSGLISFKSNGSLVEDLISELRFISVFILSVLKNHVEKESNRVTGKVLSIIFCFLFFIFIGDNPKVWKFLSNLFYRLIVFI